MLLKRKFLTLVGVLLSILLLISSTACSSNAGKESGAKENEQPKASSTTQGKDQKELPTIKIAVSDAGQIKFTPDLFIMQEIAKAGECKLDVIPIPAAEFETKRNALIASKDIPDLMFNPDSNSYTVVQSMGPKGIFYKIDTIFDKVPNFKKWADKYLEFYKIMKASDGHIYAFPKINNFDLFDWGLCIRADLLDNEAITADKIETIDDLYNALKIIKDKKGNAPWVARAEKVNENRFLPATVQMFGTGVNMYYNGKEDAFKFGPLDENFRIMVEFLNKCYKDGLIHKDAFVMDDDTYSQLLKGDKAYFFIDNMNSIHWAGPDNSRFEVILPPKVNGTRYYGTVASGNIEYKNLWTVAANTKYLDNVLKIVDWAYSDVGEEALHWGKEGYTFTRNEQGERRYIFHSEGWPYLTTEKKHVYDLGLYHNGWNVFLWTEEMFDMRWIYTDGKFTAARKMYIDNKVVPPVSPPVVFTPDEEGNKNALEQPINTFADENVLNFITGVKPMSEWNAFTARLKEMKVDELVKIYNDAYNRYKSAN